MGMSVVRCMSHTQKAFDLRILSCGGGMWFGSVSVILRRHLIYEYLAVGGACGSVVCVCLLYSDVSFTQIEPTSHQIDTIVLEPVDFVFEGLRKEYGLAGWDENGFDFFPNNATSQRMVEESLSQTAVGNSFDTPSFLHTLCGRRSVRSSILSDALFKKYSRAAARTAPWKEV